VVGMSVRPSSVEPLGEVRMLSTSLGSTRLGLLLVNASTPRFERIDGRVVGRGKSKPAKYRDRKINKEEQKEGQWIRSRKRETRSTSSLVSVIVLVLVVLDEIPTLNEMLSKVDDSRTDDGHRSVVPERGRWEGERTEKTARSQLVENEYRTLT